MSCSERKMQFRHEPTRHSTTKLLPKLHRRRQDAAHAQAHQHCSQLHSCVLPTCKERPHCRPVLWSLPLTGQTRKRFCHDAAEKSTDWGALMAPWHARMRCSQPHNRAWTPATPLDLPYHHWPPCRLASDGPDVPQPL